MPTPVDRPAALVHHALRGARRAGVLLAGVLLLAVGGALLVLPGPGTPVLFAGLALLATEFAWAERALDRAKGTAGRLARFRPSRASLVQIATVAGGCLLIIGSITAVDELPRRFLG